MALKVPKKTVKKKLKNKSPTLSHEASTTGRVAEMFLGSILLSNGFEVYQPVVDVAIDYLAFNQKKELLYIQCKSRSSEKSNMFHVSLPKARGASLPTHVFYMRGPSDNAEYWLVPFVVAKRLSRNKPNKRGRVVYTLTISESIKKKLLPYSGRYGIVEAKNWKK
ncbi:hypothetical protein [Bdellovibrio sp.]|uniref:hypothetical protein n=1 Tax=Bdellovibrio sp. TaxID=28201 RepID=UPI003221CD2B